MDIFQGIVVIFGFVYLFGFLGWVLIDGIISFTEKGGAVLMHLDPISGMWKNDDNDYQPQLATSELNDDTPPQTLSSKPDEIQAEKIGMANEVPPKEIHGKCTLMLRFENGGEYIKWQKYYGERKWDFIQSYPAIFRAEYSFHNSMDVEIMTKKIIQLLEDGFDVYSANWVLTKY